MTKTLIKSSMPSPTNVAGQAKQKMKTGLAQPKKSNGKRSAPRFDLEKFKMQFCSAAQGELITKKAVLDVLRQRAKSAGKRIRGGTESRVGPQRCNHVRWLYGTLRQMSHEFAAEIDEDLEKLSKPGANREDLVGHVYTLVLCIRATNTIFFGDQHRFRLSVASKGHAARFLSASGKNLVLGGVGRINETKNKT
jgi:hypothetical protein